jgi:membrane-associated phospholipid phosphatase
MNLKSITHTWAAVVVVVISFLHLDAPLAIWIDLHVRSHGAFQIYTSNIPDLLLLSVIILSTLSWVGYFYLKGRGIQNIHRQFFLIMGTVLPLSFVLKTLLKMAFGRIETRIWLTDNSLDGMHWFAGGEGFDGFPSGHMLVFSTLFLALWKFYPRYRSACLVVWLALGSALILTNYHFLSDVLAGGYFGCLLYYSINYMMQFRRASIMVRP